MTRTAVIQKALTWTASPRLPMASTRRDPDGGIDSDGRYPAAGGVARAASSRYRLLPCQCLPRPGPASLANNPAFRVGTRDRPTQSKSLRRLCKSGQASGSLDQQQCRW